MKIFLEAVPTLNVDKIFMFYTRDIFMSFTHVKYPYKALLMSNLRVFIFARNFELKN